MAAGFQNLRPFRKGLGRHRTRFSLFAACERWEFQRLTGAGQAQNSRNRSRVAKVGLTQITQIKEGFSQKESKQGNLL
jgi:hypothetical protein